MKIACIGNVTYDFTVLGSGFIKENGKSSFFEKTINAGGPACNAAYVISNYGRDDNSSVQLEVDFYGQIGNDSFGEWVYNNLQKDYLNIDHLNVSDNVMTPFSFIIINKDRATRTINSVRSEKDLISPSIDNIHYESDYDFILTDGKYPEESINLINANPSAISIVDAGRVNDSVIEVCENVKYIICSEEFANGITGLKLNHEYQNDQLIFNKLKKRFPNALGITITVGKYGYICDKNETILPMATFDSGLPSIDTNGAGDIFHGAFTYALASGYDYYDALEFANVTASISTTRTGGKSSCPSLEEVKRALKDKVRKRSNN